MSERYGARKTMETQGESSASTLRVPTIQNAFVNANQNGPRAMESSKNLRSLGKYFVSFWGRRIESAMSTEIAGDRQGSFRIDPSRVEGISRRQSAGFGMAWGATE
jgi:hypothetical protein